MKKIKVTVEIVQKYTKEIELPEETYSALKKGDLDEMQVDEINFNELFANCSLSEGTEENRYFITDENGSPLIN